MNSKVPFEHIILNNKNFLFYAAQNYKNVHADTTEFLNDLKRLKYIKKLLTRFVSTGELKERLILNHIIILYNTFGIIPATRMLFLKLECYHPQIKPFLNLLSVLPKNVVYKNKNINTDEIVSDNKIEDALSRI